MSDRLRNFPSIHWENLAIQEAHDRRAQHSRFVRLITPEFAQRVADLSFSYPDLPGGLVTGMAVAGVEPLSEEADMVRDRNAELEAAGLNSVPSRPGFWDHGLGRGVKGFTRTAFTFFQSLYDEVVKGSTAWLTGVSQGQSASEAARRSFGFSPGALAVANLMQDRPVNLGSGWFAGGDLSTETQEALQRGVPLREAIANEEQIRMGLPLGQFSEAFIGEQFQRVPGSEGVVDERTGHRGLPVTPGRIAANLITEPGTNAYNNLSGLTDVAANIFLDPANTITGGLTKLRNANRALVGAGARKTVIARNVDDWLDSRHGTEVAQFIADTDDYLTLHGLFRKNAVRSNVDANFISNLQQADNAADVKRLISAIGSGGFPGGGQLRELPVRQGIIGRAFGTSGLAGVFARGFGGGGSAVDVLGLRQAVSMRRARTSWFDRMAAEVGATALRIDDVSTSVDDFGQWMKAAGFSPEKMSEFMGRMAAVKPGQAYTGVEMWGITKAAYRHLADEMILDGLSPHVANAFTKVFDNIDDYRKFWINNAGNPQMFVGGRFNFLMNGQVHALPSAQLFSEFMDHAIPLLDMRRIRKGLRRSAWAKLGFEDLATKKVAGGLEKGKILPRFRLEDMESWEDLGPSVAGALVSASIQKVWKPLVLLRIAWPVRVIAEEQVRMMATGLDAAWNHPLKWAMIASGRRMTDDLLTNPMAEAAIYRSALSKKGLEFGLGAPRSLYKDEWIKVMQGDPRYWEGLAIELQQLADDPLTRRIAQALDEVDESVSMTDVLRPIKDEWLDDTTDLGRARIALAASSSNWEIVNVREAAEAVIDDRMARLMHKTGSDYVTFDYLTGLAKDSYGNPLSWDNELGSYVLRDQAGNVTRRIDLPEELPPRGTLSRRVLNEKVQPLAARIDPIASKAQAILGGADVPLFNSVDEVLDAADDLDEFDKVILALEDEKQKEILTHLYGGLGFDPVNMASRLRRNAEALAAGTSGEARRLAEEYDGIRRGLIRVRDESRLEVPFSGRADRRALEMIEMSGNPELLRQVYGGYTPQPGQPSLDEIIERTANNRWTPREVANMVNADQGQMGSFKVSRVSDDVIDDLFPGGEGTAIWSAKTDAGADTGEIIYIGHDGWITGHIKLKRDPATNEVIDVEMFKTATGDERTVWYDAVTGEVGAPDSRMTQISIPGAKRWDAAYLLGYLIDPENTRALIGKRGRSFVGGAMPEIKPEQMYDLAFGGVPIRDWLAAAGHADPTQFGLADVAEFMRAQYGAIWSEANGPLGAFPSIGLSRDGALSMGSTLLRMGGGDLGNLFRAEDISKLAPGWPQRHIMAQPIRRPDPELIKAVATGKLGDNITLSTGDVLDEAEKVDRISKIGNALRDGWGAPEFRANLPQFTKVALPEDTRRMDTVIDHMFDIFMSHPTNKLSRSPAFKQFYWKRVSELLPYMDEATKAKAIKAARDAGVGRGDLRSMVKAAFTTQDVTEVALERMADDFVKGRFATATGDITNLVDADEIAKAFALQETKRLLYDLTKKTQFFDVMRNILPFGEAWFEIVTTWGRLIGENPRLIRRLQQGLEGARQEGIFYNDPGTGEEVFAMPHLEFLSKMLGVSDEEDPTQPKFTGRVEGVNLALNNFLPGVGPLVQMPAASFARDLFDKPELRWARDLIFPYGYPDAENPGAIANSLMPAWFRKALTSIGRPTGEDQRLFNNTVIDVLRAMELNGEIQPNATPEQAAQHLEEARKRARNIFILRSLQQFVGPTGAQVRWDVDVDPSGEAFAYQVLATEYRQILEDHEGDRTQAFFAFVNEFGFDPAGIITAKTESLRPRSVTEEGLDFQQQNPDLFAKMPLTAYYVAPDPPDGKFNYTAYLAQLRSGDRMPVTPEQWWTERNRLLGSIRYEKARRAAVDAGIRNKPSVAAYLRALRFNLMEQYPGYGFENIGVAAQPEQRQFMAEFETWRTDERLSQTNAGQGLNRYLAERERVLALAENEWGVSEEGFANAKSTFQLRQYLLNLGYALTKQYQDFGVIFQRHYMWEVEDPEPVTEGQLLGVDLTTAEE